MSSRRPETAWSLLAELGVLPEGFELFRNIVYAFELGWLGVGGPGTYSLSEMPLTRCPLT